MDVFDTSTGKIQWDAPSDFALDGSRRTGKLRVRPGWFGFAVVEELVEYRDGTSNWRRIASPHELPRNLSAGARA